MSLHLPEYSTVNLTTITLLLSVQLVYIFTCVFTANIFIGFYFYCKYLLQRHSNTDLDIEYI